MNVNDKSEFIRLDDIVVAGKTNYNHCMLERLWTQAFAVMHFMVLNILY